ncbi:hypothetical protein AVEN_25488-1 [Araneus ventricosus]|uniref:EGF-like domain-containing protein n=1 Tax=Araneus ventricosus TaxID=182803 RepID=A0A4Y2CRZ1_ARAVE|nr:hypothetical protein AVEN_25488-1 [Araneus ventricosus]
MKMSFWSPLKVTVLFLVLLAQCNDGMCYNSGRCLGRGRNGNNFRCLCQPGYQGHRCQYGNHCELVVWSQLRNRKVPDLKPDATKDLPCKSDVEIKRSPACVLWKLERRVPTQVSSSSSNYGSK